MLHGHVCAYFEVEVKRQVLIDPLNVDIVNASGSGDFVSHFLHECSDVLSTMSLRICLNGHSGLGQNAPYFTFDSGGDPVNFFESEVDIKRDMEVYITSFSSYAHSH